MKKESYNMREVIELCLEDQKKRLDAATVEFVGVQKVTIHDTPARP